MRPSLSRPRVRPKNLKTRKLTNNVFSLNPIPPWEWVGGRTVPLANSS